MDAAGAGFGGCEMMETVTSPPDIARGRCRRHPQRSPFSRPLPLSGNPLLPDAPGPASGGYLPERFPKRRKRVPGCNQAVKQADSKNGERENPERIFAVSGCNRHGCTRTPEGPLRNGEPGAMWEAA